MTFSQIWLIPFVDDRQFTYLTKFEKKKPRLNIRTWWPALGAGFFFVFKFLK